MFQIKNEIKPAPQKVQQYIAGKGIHKVTCQYQYQRQLDIILIKNAVKHPVCSSYVQVDQRIKPKDISIKYIHQQPT